MYNLQGHFASYIYIQTDCEWLIVQSTTLVINLSSEPVDSELNYTSFNKFPHNAAEQTNIDV